MAYDSKKFINEYTTNKWQRIWNIQNIKLNEIKRDIYCWTNPKLNWKDDTALNRLRIEHTRITQGFLMARKELTPHLSILCLFSTIDHGV